MIGLPFRDKSDSPERGLTWSDFSVLFRSVRTDSGTLVDVFKEEKIPFIIKGLARLFEIDEVVAIQAAFRYAAKEIDLTQFKALWRIGNLCNSRSFDNGLKFIEEVWEIFESDKYEKLNLQQFYLDMLSAFGITEESVPDNRGSIAFYSLGKFSEVISDFESIN